ncbi:MAG: hypothetical protein OJJ21_03975 [Ferrovibrio sp.]|uniref:hypothetical protein n=1 Tax=Ferrovibrio sp. TaxID=1917215 RepID=UPI00260B4127|nr:hypothetical protein [Ferrovibrio sp.]MCW0232736.1 hypothetical protein [Ferrovibrio sp.]
MRDLNSRITSALKIMPNWMKMPPIWHISGGAVLTNGRFSMTTVVAGALTLQDLMDITIHFIESGPGWPLTLIVLFVVWFAWRSLGDR